MAKYTVLRWFAARWKALMPLVSTGISEVLAEGPLHLDTPRGWKVLVFGIATSAMVHYKRNMATS